MKSLLSLFLAGLVLTTVGCAASQAQKAVANANAATDVYTPQQIAEHATETDCWTSISGNVYDITSYISKHPGGTRILEGCGKDATNLFTGTSMMGRVHSAVARAALSTLKIGTLHD